jgi:hypothetical protein
MANNGIFSYYILVKINYASDKLAVKINHPKHPAPPIEKNMYSPKLTKMNA